MSDASRFEQLSPAKQRLLLARLGKQARAPQAGAQAVAPDIEPSPRRAAGGPYPLSFSQRRLWFIDRLEPGASTYILGDALRLRGRLDVAALRRALGEIVRRHEALRTVFELGEDGPVQRVLAPGPLGLAVADLSALEPPARERETRRLMRREAQTPFDLSRGPLLRARLLRLSPGDHVALLTMHHIVSDGWSVGILVRELSALYAAFAAGRPSPLPELAIQYPDFADWQRRTLAGETLEEHLRYWRGELAGAPGVLALPADRPRPPLQRSRGATFESDLPPVLSAALAALGRQGGNTLFMVLLAGFGLLLSRQSGQDELLIGAPIANRNRTETEPLIGFFVNTLALRLDVAAAATGEELLARVRHTTLGAFAHQDLPFERVVEALQPERDMSRAPLVQASFALQNAPLGELELAELSLSPVEVPGESSTLDLVVEAVETAAGIATVWHYSTDLFDRTTVLRFAAQLERLLAGLAAEPRRPLAELPLLTAAERHQLLVEWSGTPAGTVAPGDTLDRLFAASAAESPQAPALEWRDGALSYGELAAAAAGLAERLAALGAGAGDGSGDGSGRPLRVGLALKRSPELVVAVLAVLAAGGAYVPLDPTYPRERLAFMLEDSGVDLLLTSGETLARLPPAAGARVLRVEDLLAAPLGGSPPREGWARGVPDGLAYIIYTSGSTGRPKGVPVAHRGAANAVLEGMRHFGLTPADRVLQFSSASFDASVVDLFSTFAAGACLRLLPAGPLPLGPELAAALRGARITAVILPPSVLATLGEEPLPELRCLVVAAEKCPAELAARWAPGRRLANGYGPTETSIFATVWVAEAGDRAPRPAFAVAPPIGRPIAHARVHLLDRLGRPVPIGAAGELFLGGDGVVRGYLDRPERTAESFVPDGWNGGAAPGSRLYRSGDLARFRSDGELDILGRIDTQVKLRGLRIELGEIEAALGEHRAVRQAAVALRDSVSGPRLVAWVVAAGEGGEPPGADLAADLRAHLRSRLPEFMVPAAFVPVAALPLNPSGKLDRLAIDRLPEATEAAPRAADFAAPRGGLESEVAAVWRQVLGVERVGSGDGFFDLGGHSLLLVQVQAKLRERLGEEVSILDLFRHPTVAALAGHLESRRAGAPETAGDPPEPPAAAASIAAPRGADRAIAIVGMAGRFPGAPDLATFWRNLQGGVESIAFFSDAELAAAGVPAEVLADPGYVRAGGVVDGADLFDAGYFGINPREAELLDPQHRLFLECAAEALDHAGYGSDLRRGRVGVFAGAGTISYAVQNLFGRGDVDPFEITLGNDKDFLATRAAYKLDLKGPAFTVQTACSTALVAVHLASRSLLDGECELALAGGVTLDFPQRSGYLYKEGGIASPDGHNRAFDAAAGGTVGGNGAGVVLLKPLAAALADGDPIHAVLRGSALNNDGAARMGYTTPSEEGQAAVIAAAQAAAGVHPATVQYVEAHGSATPIGDPIEVAALIRAFRAGGATGGNGERTAIGSVKTNVGHTGSAAGIAGLLKTALALEHRQIPPSLHYTRPNPAIDFAASPFYVATELADWPAGGAAAGGEATPRRAGVSSFGIGGTNVHVVLEEAPERPPAEPGRPWQLLSLSARTPAALEAATDRLVEHLRLHAAEDLADVAFTLHTGRKGWEHRRAVVGRDRDEAIAALAGRDPSRLLEGRTTPESRPGRPVAFLLAGIGEQYAGLAAGLWRDEPAFRQPLERCAEILSPLGVDLAGLFAGGAGEKGDEAGRGPDLRRMLGRAAGGETAASPLDRTSILQPALFAIEYALARLWMEWGVVPRALLGYSLGEYLAACLAGVLSLDDALALVARRARLIEALPPGAMLATPLGEAALAAEIAALAAGGRDTSELAIAAVNGPGHAVAAGPVAAVAALAERLAAAGHATRQLRTTHAFHSPAMRPAAAELTALARTMTFRAPRIPYLSNVTGTWIRADQATDPAYWAEHLCRTVRFGDGVAELWRDPQRVLLEIGPGQSLSALALQHPAAAGAADATSVPSLPSAYERQPDRAFLLAALGKLWLTGVAVDWRGVYGRERRRRLELPAYPFERRRYWMGGSRESGERAAPQAAASKPSPAQGAARSGPSGPHLDLPVWRRTPPPPRLRPGELAADGRRWLVFADAGGLGGLLAARLAADGARVATVVAGDRFGRGGGAGEEGFTLDPARAEDYEALFAELGSPPPDRIVHLWGLDRPPVTPGGAEDADGLAPGTFAAAQERGFASLLALVHGLAARIAPGEAGISSLKTLVAARGIAAVTAADRLAPEQAPLAALCLALPREVPGVVCRSADLDLATPGSWREEALAEALLAELARAPLAASPAEPDDGVSLAYRGGERWVRACEPVALDEGGAVEAPAGGAIVLVGRLEGRLAEARRRLAELGARTAVVSPSTASPGGEPAGSDELSFVADLGDEGRMREILVEIEAAAGGIAGVIFEPDPAPFSASPLVALRRAEAEAALLEAAGRLSLLARLLAARRPAFVWLGSSLDAFLAPPGGVLAAAVAALAGAFAQEQRRAGAAPWTAIGWESGAHAEPATVQAVGAVLRLLLAPGAPPQILVSAGAGGLGARLRESALAAALADAGGEPAPARHGRPNLRNPYVPPSTATERSVVELWRLLLGIDEVGIHDSFLELGGDSLLATQLVTRVRERLNARVSLPEFFELPTAAALASRIDALRPATAAAEAAEVASLLEQLESLSAEEVEAMLAARGMGMEP